MSEVGGNGSERKGRSADGPPERLAGLLPGDAVRIGEAAPVEVVSVFVCKELLGGVLTQWRWVFLADGSLLELAPRGTYLYDRHEVLEPGTPRYEELAAQDGALVRFERLVRRGEAGRRQVRVTIHGREYRVAYTGTVTALRLGTEPAPAPWRAFRDDPDANVYFGLVATDDEREVVAGLWTEGVCLSFGRRLEEGDVCVGPRS